MTLYPRNWHARWADTTRRRVLRPVLPLALAALALGAGAAPALAISGEDPRTIALFTPGCFSTNADAVIACFDGGDSGSPRCDLFSVQGAGDTLPTGLCATRDILNNPQLIPDQGPIETNVTVRGSSHGYIRALRLQGVGDPIHTVTQTFGNDVESVRVSPAAGANDSIQRGQCSKIRLPGDHGDRFNVCTEVAGALPLFAGASSGDLRFVITYDYKTASGASNFGTDRLMTVWACPGVDAQCVTGDPTQAVTRRAALLNEDWLRLWLTDSGLRLLR